MSGLLHTLHSDNLGFLYCPSPFFSYSDLKPYLDSRILVVSVFGKSARDAVSCKANVLDSAFKKQIFRNNLLESNDINMELLVCELSS